MLLHRDARDLETALRESSAPRVLLMEGMRRSEYCRRRLLWLSEVREDAHCRVVGVAREDRRSRSVVKMCFVVAISVHAGDL